MNQFKDMMEKAKALGTQMQNAQENLRNIEAEGQSGGGLVKVVMSGKGVVKKVTIDPSLINVDEKEVLEDLVAAAFTDARQKMETLAQEEMTKATGGLSLPPGFNMPGL
ncbi:MAG: YbaB/EbfC family nucleoid-associated protein [Holosporaceae bacterium]